MDDGPDGSRSYAVYTPGALPARVAVPLVVVLHGCKQKALDAARGTQVNELADRAGFVAVYPEQSADDNVARCWNWFEPKNQVRGSGEPAAIARITERVLAGNGGSGAPLLDRERVHAMGLSAGGAMAGILAATYPDLYASVGIHSAPQYAAASTALTAVLAMKTGGPDPERQGRLAYDAMGPRARVVPVIVIQGDADRTVRAGNGDYVARQWLMTSRLASPASLGLDFERPHARRDGSSPGGLPYSVRSWTDLAGRPVVHLWTVSGLGHAWSGGASAGSFTDPRGPDATRAMYDFFCAGQRDRAPARSYGSAPSRIVPRLAAGARLPARRGATGARGEVRAVGPKGAVRAVRAVGAMGAVVGLRRAASAAGRRVRGRLARRSGNGRGRRLGNGRRRIRPHD